MNRRKCVICAVILILVGAGIALWSQRSARRVPVLADKAESVSAPSMIGEVDPADVSASSAKDAGVSTATETEEGADSAIDPEEAREAAEEAIVDAFDARVDAWMEPTGTVTTAAVDEFLSAFNKVPKERQEECLQRALNLIPDENVMLLAGILFDKRQDKELVELVFNDILNRDESVKQPILKLVYADRKHPCWADVAWIMDVTGEKDETK